MDWPRLIGGLVATLLTAAAFAWLLRDALRPPEVRRDGFGGGAVLIRPSPALRALLVGATLLFLVAFAAFVWLLVVEEADAKLQRVAWFAMPLFVVLGVGCALEARVRFWLDGDGIRGQTAIRGWREVRWGEVGEVEFERRSKCLRLRERGGDTIKVSCLHRGHNHVFDVLMAKVPEKVWSGALRDYVANYGQQI
ncbi:MAG: hypothetical protein NXI31_07820 [bacterium]|nr:hypothetical protein [bacterium]